MESIINETRFTALTALFTEILLILVLFKPEFNEKELTPTIPSPNPIQIKVSEPLQGVSNSNLQLILHKKLELLTLAEVAFFEARGESSMQEVIDVVLNRVNHDSFSNDIVSVVNKPFAFSYLNKGSPLNTDSQSVRASIMNDNIEDKIRAMKVAESTLKALYDGTWKDTTHKALYYINPSKLSKIPDWVDYKYLCLTKGNHEFFTWHKLK